MYCQQSMLQIAVLLFLGCEGISTNGYTEITMTTTDITVMEDTVFNINCTTGGGAEHLLAEPVSFKYTSQETANSPPGTTTTISENLALSQNVDSTKYELSFSVQSAIHFHLKVKATTPQDTGVYTCSRGTNNASSFIEVRSKQDSVCTCSDGSLRYGNSCFRFHYEQLSWPEASYMCDILGSQLAHIESHDEYQFIQAYALDSQGAFAGSGFWVGATSSLLPGHWHWKDDMTEVNIDDLGAIVSSSAHHDCLMLSKQNEFLPKGQSCRSVMHFICKTKVSKCI